MTHRWQREEETIKNRWGQSQGKPKRENKRSHDRDHKRTRGELLQNKTGNRNFKIRTTRTPNHDKCWISLRREHGAVWRRCVCTPKPHLSLLLRSLEEESIDDGNSVGLNVLISPGIGKISINKIYSFLLALSPLLLWCEMQSSCCRRRGSKLKQQQLGFTNPVRSSTYPWRCGMSCPMVISCATLWYRSWLLSTMDSRMARDRCSTAVSMADLFT